MAMKYATPREFATGRFRPIGPSKGLGEMEFVQYMEGCALRLVWWEPCWCWVRFDDSPHGSARLLSEKEVDALGLMKGDTP